ncbi:MAG: RHS repeat-associated core domain-containing protein [Verrucomicrobia bacterium]|nr:RHS repeat-associated core domain-containing protein [Verrucomicrobiota bacterium]
MVYVFLFFALLSTLFADDRLSSVTENDPSSFVEGVSMITGDFYSFSEDYLVQGEEPISLKRAYVSRGVYMHNFHHLIATYYQPVKMMNINEPNGTLVSYHLEKKHYKGSLDVGRNFYGLDDKERLKPKKIRLNPKLENIGISNTATGKVSAQTNLKNQHIIFDSDCDFKGKSFTFHAADGTIRLYKHIDGQDHPPDYKYKLVLELLPNGRSRFYVWGKDRLLRVETRSYKKKILSAIDFANFNPEFPPNEITHHGSDQRSITFRYNPAPGKQRYLASLTTPDYPTKSFDTTWKKRTAEDNQFFFPYITDVKLPKGRTVHVEYGEEPEYRVKHLSSPVGKDNQLLTTHTFSYSQNSSHVIDIQGNKAQYHWNNQDRLTSIERYVGSDFLHSEERFTWDGSLIRCKSLLDKDKNAIFSRTFAYDNAGNVILEKFYGNLSGNSPPLTLGTNGLPIEDGVETYAKTKSFSNDSFNLLVREEEPNGLVTTYTYLSGWNLVKTKTLSDHGKAKVHFTYDYDDDLILIRETVDDGVCKTVKKITPIKEDKYYGLPHIIEEKYLDGSQEILLQKTVITQYKPGALIGRKEIYDANGTFRYAIEYDYDEKGRVTRETNPLGQESVSQYDELGNRCYLKDFSGRVIKSEYDFSNRLTQNELIDKGFHRTFHYSYDTKHNLESETDDFGQTTSYKYDLFGKRTETSYPPIPSESGSLITPILRQNYDCRGNEILRIDAEGNETRTSYNAYGKPILVTHPDSSTEKYTYYLNGELKTYTDQKGIVTSYIYDYLNRILEKTIFSNQLLTKETFEYTGYRIMAKTDAEGNKTEYTYDLAGRKASETFGGETTYFFYDELGRQNKTQKANLITLKKFDLLNRSIEETNQSPSGELFRKVQYEYDDAGNKKSIIRSIAGAESKETMKYDPFNRLIEKIDAEGFKETISYCDVLNDFNQKVLQKTHTDAMGLQTIETHDTHHRIARIEKKKEKTLSILERFYSPTGHISQQVDTIFAYDGTTRQTRTRWGYDPMGRQITLIEAEGTPETKITRRTYTPRGELKELTKPNGTQITYSYNDLGQLTSISSSDGTVHHQMSYNRLGHLQKSDDLSRTTDPLGRIKSETFPQQFTLYNHYNPDGRRDECQIPNANCIIQFEYNPTDLKRVLRKTNDHQELYAYLCPSYDLSGNLLEEHLIGPFGPVYHTYNPSSRKASIEAPFFSQKILRYDPVGNIRQMQIQQEEIFYEYDDLYQLTFESGPFSHSYLYDSLYNRLVKDSSPYTINALNQVVSHLTYDKNGNPIQQGGTTYTYDALDRLIQIQTPFFIQTFKYDSFHRCLSKTTTQSNRQSTLHFLYDGKNEIGSFNENLELQELRILGQTRHAEIGASIAIELQGAVYAPIHDLQGNIAALLPLNLSPPTHYRYSAFGEEKIEGTAISPWRFSSKRTDPLTNLVYYGRRFYIPTLGRWLTPDPAGFTDGMNLYAFVRNDPLTHFDEYGLLTYDYKLGWVESSWGSPYSWNGSTYNNFPSPRGADPRMVRTFDPYPKGTPNYYVNGIFNTRSDNRQGAQALLNTHGGRANIIPFYSESFGIPKDLSSVWHSLLDRDYSTPAIKKLERDVRFDCHLLDAANDPRKVFITPFSRGSTDTYHAIKNMTQHRDRLIITACGPIMILPRSLGFKVTNLISSADWCSLGCNRGYTKHPDLFDRVADTVLLPAKDWDGITADHFFLSKTYQDGIKKYSVEDYKDYGALR